MGHTLPRFALLALFVAAGFGATAETPPALQQQKEACRRLDEAATAAAAGQRAEFSRRLKEAAERMDSLAREKALSDALKKELTAAARELRARAETAPAGFSPQAALRLLERVAAALPGATDLAFQGSYSQTKVQEPAYGGHASAMGPPPEAAPSTGGPSPVQFELVPR